MQRPAPKLALLVAACALPVGAHAATAVLTWLPVAGAVGYRIERATKVAGPWNVSKDTGTDEGRVSNLQAEAVEGLRKGTHCFRVRSVFPEAQMSMPSEPQCVTLPRAEINFGRLTEVASSFPLPTTPTRWVYCAGENEQCTFNGTRRVRYGKDPQWIELTAVNGITCFNGAFGSDPLPGNFKICEVAEAQP